MNKNTQTNPWNWDNSYTRLPEFFYTMQLPEPVRSPELVIFNHSLAVELGIPIQPEVFAGNAVPIGADPLAQAYAGHQFGHFTMLGDGRAVLVGEQITPSGTRVDVQLKGSGRTPYSRGGDGRAALAPMLREYIISEAMNALGVPTTRSLAVMATGETVIREKALPGAVLTRIAASHIRTGTFEYAARFGTIEELRSLADYTISRHFSEITDNTENKYLTLLQETVKRQAYLIAKWQAVGFVHGVMNTDNMAVSGETIDYGPCAFMDRYEPSVVFSSIDTHGRYSYENQPKIALWNLARLAECLLPLLHNDSDMAVRLAEQETSRFRGLYHSRWLAEMGAKLGLYDIEPNDQSLIGGLLLIMQQNQADYTNTFRMLTTGEYSDSELFSSEDFLGWRDQWQSRVSRQSESADAIKKLMMSRNPAVIPRNHLVEEALSTAEKGEMDDFHKLLAILKEPYSYTGVRDLYTAPPPPSSCRYRTFCGT